MAEPAASTRSRVSSIESLTIRVSHKSRPWDYAGRVRAIAEPVEIFAVANALRSIYKTAGIVATSKLWCFKIEYGGYHLGTEAVKYHIHPKKLEIRGKGDGRRFENAIRQEMVKYRKIKELPDTHSLHQTRIIRWGLFEMITLLASSFERLNIAVDDLNVQKTGIPMALIGDYNCDAERMMASARYAYESGDVTTLQLLLDDLKELWQEHKKRLIGSAYTAIDTLVEKKAVNAAEPDVARALDALDAKNRLKWPLIRATAAFPTDAKVISDGAYEKCKVDGNMVYRRILPARVSLVSGCEWT